MAIYEVKFETQYPKEESVNPVSIKLEVEAESLEEARPRLHSAILSLQRHGMQLLTSAPLQVSYKSGQDVYNVVNTTIGEFLDSYAPPSFLQRVLIELKSFTRHVLTN